MSHKTYYRHTGGCGLRANILFNTRNLWYQFNVIGEKSSLKENSFGLKRLELGISKNYCENIFEEAIQVIYFLI